MNRTQKRVLHVLSRITKSVTEDADEAIVYSGAIGEMLDNLQSEDFFGTEGQGDPRGDQRDTRWSMSRVQGVDR